MRRLSPALLAAALAASAGLHLAALALFAGDAPVQQEGGAPAAAAALGSSFADLSAGSVPATGPTQTAPAPAPEHARTPSPDPASDATQIAAAPAPVEAGRPSAAQADAAPSPAPRAPAIAERAEPGPTATVSASAAPLVAALPAADPPAPAVPVSPERPSPVRPETTSAQARVVAPAPAAAPGAPIATAAAPAPAPAALAPQHRLVAASDLAPESAERPPARPDMPRRAATTPRADAPARAAAAGNADRSARAGSDAGRQEAEAARAATRPAERTATSGNAAASNYPGLVMRHVSRARRPDVSARGAARVTFSIAGSGALAGARLARSSGSAALDRAALTVIRRAAPFPAPPAGAARTFTVEIRGR